MKKLAFSFLAALALTSLPSCRTFATNVKGTVCKSEEAFTGGWEKGVGSLATITDGIFPPVSIVIRFLGGSGSAVFKFVCGGVGTVADAAGDAAAVVVDKPLQAIGALPVTSPAPALEHK